MSRFNKREGRKRSSNDDDEEVCVVCFREVEIYSIGECDHPVCHECSTRMRVLCGRTECPICRKDMAMVVFTRTVQPFSSLQYRNLKCERRYSIYFQDDFIMKAYDSLLEHSCLECEGRVKFRSFNLLKDHMRKIHENFYCELCVENLKIFTHERRSYNRTLLAHHRRVGDTDDKSHRGHPLCEFCDSRFMDNDDLFRHLRRDHYFCHFCDADGQHQYYEDYEALRKHFQHDHFLCEEGTCMEERFTSAFRTKLDMQAHAAQHHSHAMSKSEARQARTVDIAFTVNHRPAPFAERGRGGRRGDAGRGRRGGGEGRMQQDVDEQIAAAMAMPPSQMLSKQQAIDINCKQDFPSLNGLGGQAGEGGAGNKSIAHRLAQQNRFTIRATKGQALTEEEFPSLGSAKGGGTNTSAPPTTSLHLSVNTKKNTSTNHQGHSNVSIEYNCTKPSATLSDSITTFAGRGRGKPRIGAVSHSGNITVKSSSGAGARPKSAALEEDFPSLQPSSKPFVNPFQATTTTASWTPSQVNTATVVASKPPKKAVSNGDAKAANAKKLPVFESSSDFPSLAPSLENLEQKLNYSGRSSLKIPMKKVNNAHVADKNLENEENAGGGRGKKKKKGAPPPTKGSSFESSKNSQNATAASTKPSKKKPFVLSNIYDDLDPDEPVEDYSKTRQGEYEAVAPVLSSNINFISADAVSGKDTKKSELQIGTLKAPDISSDDFPSLGGPPNRGQKKSGKAPPSFEGKGNSKDRSSWNPSSQQSKKRPSIPPGFSKKHPGIPSGFANTDMTFTSSLGQKFAISPTSEKPEAAPPPPKPQKKKGAKPPGFIFPPNFDQRNKLLIDAINFACEGNPDTFKKFKHLAEVFRSGRMKGYEYYAKCRQVMGKDVFHQILPELLALLPDISKQQAVLEAYRTVDDGQGCEAFFAVCAVCQQVLVSEDFPSHMASHEFPADEFPSLKPPSAPSQRRK